MLGAMFSLERRPFSAFAPSEKLEGTDCMNIGLVGPYCERDENAGCDGVSGGRDNVCLLW